MSHKFITTEEYRNLAYKEGTIIAEYAKQLYLLDRKILQVGASYLRARDQVYMVIMKFKEHKNIAMRRKGMEYLSRMNKEDFPTSCDKVLEAHIELETLSNLTLDGVKTSSYHRSSLLQKKGPKIMNFTNGLHGFERPDGLYEVFVINAKGKFIKNKIVKCKKTKRGVSIIEDKTITNSVKSISRDEAKHMFKCKF